MEVGVGHLLIVTCNDRTFAFVQVYFDLLSSALSSLFKALASLSVSTTKVTKEGR